MNKEMNDKINDRLNKIFEEHIIEGFRGYKVDESYDIYKISHEELQAKHINLMMKQIKIIRQYKNLLIDLKELFEIYNKEYQKEILRNDR